MVRCAIFFCTSSVEGSLSREIRRRRISHVAKESVPDWCATLTGEEGGIPRTRPSARVRVGRGGQKWKKTCRPLAKSAETIDRFEKGPKDSAFPLRENSEEL